MIGVKIVQNIQTIYIRLKLDSPKILIMLANGILEKSQLYRSFPFLQTQKKRLAAHGLAFVFYLHCEESFVKQIFEINDRREVL